MTTAKLLVLLPLLLSAIAADEVSVYDESSLSNYSNNSTSGWPVGNISDAGGQMTINETTSRPIRFTARQTSFAGSYRPIEIDPTEHYRFDEIVKEIGFSMAYFVTIAPPPKGSDMAFYVGHAKFRVEWPAGAITTWSWSRSGAAINTLVERIRAPIQNHVYPLTMNMDSESNRDPPALRLTVGKIPSRLTEYREINVGDRAYLKICYYTGERVHLSGLIAALERNMAIVSSNGRFFREEEISQLQGAYVKVKSVAGAEATLLSFTLRALQLEITDRGPTRSSAFTAILESDAGLLMTYISGGPANMRSRAAS